MTLPPLVIMLAAARAELSAETPNRLHTDHTSKLLDADGEVTQYTDEGGIGPPFTSTFHRLLALRERYQPDFLMRESLEEVNDWCAARHPNHRREGERYTLCGAVIVLAVRWTWGTQAIGYHLLYPEPVIRSLLSNGLSHAADWRQGRATRRPRTAADIVIERLPRPRRSAA